jgi:Mg-chelatase subunit ChlD
MKKILISFISGILVISLFLGAAIPTMAVNNGSTAFPNLKEKNNSSKKKDEEGTNLYGKWVRSTDGKSYYWQLSWDKVTYSKGYRIYKSTNNGETFELYQEITDKKKTTFNDQINDFSTSLHYKITYIHGNNESAVSNTVETDAMLDSDEDGIADLTEYQLHSNPNDPDTDDDGLLDGFEYDFSKTSLTDQDTDSNGIVDADEDLDQDGLSNLEEQTHETDPLLEDTDKDEVNDAVELENGTNPLNPDTDEDHLPDGLEPEFGTDPLNPHTKDSNILDGELNVEYTVSTTDIEQDPLITPTIKIKTSASNAIATTITNMEGTDANIFETLPGYIGAPFDFETDEEFEEAQVTFSYDQSVEDAEHDTGFKPVVYFYNPETELLEKVENQSYDLEDNTVTANLEHFSTYILLNGLSFEEAWNKEMKLPSTDEDGNVKNIDVVFSIDSSGSMDWNDPSDLRKLAASSFVDRLKEEDRSAVVDFDSYAYTRVNLTTDKTKVKYAISQIDSVGGTNLYSGLKAAVDELTTNGNADHEKYIIFLTDGDGTWYESALTSAKANNITVYTIGLGSGINRSLLERIADETGGKFFFASDASNLEEIFDETAGDTIDTAKDSDNDGISDYHEENGYKIQNGIWITTNPHNADTDGDGLKDGAEAKLRYTTSTNIAYYKTTSRPDQKDTDGDGIYDGADSRPKLYDVSKTNLVLMSELAYVNLEKKEGSKADSIANYSDVPNHESITNRIDLLKGWTIVKAEDSHFYDSGLGAVTLKHGKTMVIAYRGTEAKLSGFNDIVADIQLALFNSNHQINNAQRYASNSILDNLDTTSVYITGHSLGGYLAQKISYDIIKNNLTDNLMMFFWNRNKIEDKLDNENYLKKSVTFAAPGFLPSIIAPPVPVTALLSDNYNNKITNYRVDGDKISQYGLKLGEKVNVDNLQVKDITGDSDDENGIYGPHSITEYYAHFLGL